MVDEKLAAERLAVPIGMTDSDMDEFGSIDPETESEEWHLAWQRLAEEFGDIERRDAATDECWQYMGSYLDGQVWRHEFRHRALFGSGGYASRNYPATSGWVPAPSRMPSERTDRRFEDPENGADR